jgi:SAM-dependent methyltransferase
VIKNEARLRFTVGSAKTYLSSTRAAQPLLRMMGCVAAKLFDWYHNVDTCGTTVEGVEHTQYAGTHPRTISIMLKDLNVRHEDFVFVDFGSGKGRVLLGASEYPFKRVIGVEIDRKLHDIAVENIHRYRTATRKCHDVESVCRDATEYEFPPERAVLYFFNPFGREIADRVLKNLADSLNEHPREIVIINLGSRLEPCIRTLKGIRLIKHTKYHKIFGTSGSSGVAV